VISAKNLSAIRIRMNLRNVVGMKDSASVIAIGIEIEKENENVTEREIEIVNENENAIVSEKEIVKYENEIGTEKERSL